MKRRHGRCRFGFFVALRGFTEGVESTLAASRESGSLIDLLQEAEIQRLVGAGDGAERNDLLKELHRDAVVRG